MDISHIIPQKVFERLSYHAKHALQAMQRIALEYPSYKTYRKNEVSFFIEPAHLLMALLKEKGSLAQNVLEAHHIHENDVLHGIHILEEKEHPPESSSHPPKTLEPPTPIGLYLSETLKRVIKKAVAEAHSFGETYVGTEHLLLSILEQEKQILTALKEKELKGHLDAMLSERGELPRVEKLLRTHLPESPLGERQFLGEDFSRRAAKNHSHGGASTKTKKTRGAQTIQYFSRDLTEKAERNELDPVIAREKEVARVIAILLKRTKNNPLLIGEPGVGKTAIVELLAQKIERGEVPEKLLGRRVVSLDLGLLVSGTVFRGEFESRLKELLKEVEEYNVILFIDEIHTLIGTGAAQGSLDAANLLKPALSSGTIQCIGATTFHDYRSTIEKDSALERRFQTIQIEELNAQGTKLVLTHLKILFEKHYGITINHETIDEVIAMSGRYIQNRFFPDKAIDVLDEACARLTSRDETNRFVQRMHTLQKRRIELTRGKEKAIEDEHYENALRLKREEETIRDELSAVSRLRRGESADTITLTKEGVRELISEITGIPVEDLSEKETKRWMRLEHELGRRVVGQRDALALIAKTLRRGRVGIHDPRRPWGSFLFLGPTGVGKTETARVLAEYLAPKNGKDTLSHTAPKNIVRLDMSEFSEPHSIAKIIGAPPGYVGYEDEGILSETIRRYPFSLVLFDEIEKAHPQIFNILLQILEEGELTTSSGKRINFKNTIVIFTSNIGTEKFTNEATHIGFDTKNMPSGSREKLSKRFNEIKDEAVRQLKKFLRPEIVSRIDHIIVFKPLEMESIKRIVSLRLGELAGRLERSNLRWSPALLQYLTKKSFDPAQGARRVRKIIEEEVETKLTDYLMSHVPEEGVTLHLDIGKNGVTITST